MDAALACLIEHGYAATTSGLVCERAGVSRGAHLHHFGTTSMLLAGALQELAERRVREVHHDVAALTTGPRPSADALDQVWRWFDGPLFHASVDLAAAARTDPELRAALEPVERELNRETLLRCREMFARDADDSRLDHLIQMTLATVRGLALLPILQPGNGKATRQWAYTRQQLLALLEAARDAPEDR